MRYIILLISLSILVCSCGSLQHHSSKSATPLETSHKNRPTASKVNKLGYSIQVGAFSSIKNAVRLTQKFKRQGLDAYYFIHDSGLYKVRFGSYLSYRDAIKQAKELQNQKRLDTYYIVKPEEYAVSKQQGDNNESVRESLVATAERFIGIPYHWGGVSEKTGFDCSGLTMVVYRLNGIDLPRVSTDQFNFGRQVSKQELKKGDLVFFDTKRRNRVSHVGIYKGDGLFIHAPRRGKKIQISSLGKGYFKRHYMGGVSLIAN